MRRREHDALACQILRDRGCGAKRTGSEEGVDGLPPRQRGSSPLKELRLQAGVSLAVLHTVHLPRPHRVLQVLRNE